MSSKMQSNCFIALLVLLSIFSCLEAQLQVGFYGYSCPSAEAIVKQQVTNAFKSNPGIAPGLVRMHFHDCFVRGCDASILIDSTTGITAEKDSPVNNPSLRGFEVIDAAKAILETQCKGIVSCADILAFAARDSIALAQGPAYSVPSGRKDGRVSIASEVLSNIPSPAMNGCDASILIDSTTGNTAEKDSPVNNPSLRGFEVIDAAKTILETLCKGIVSCADILAFAARDSIALSLGPVYPVPSGRRDGRVSLASEVLSNIPSPAMSVDQLTTNFANKQLTQDEMVTLSGAHTIGVSHCSIITGIDDRLYNFNGTNMPDPALNPSYVPQLQAACPKGSTSTSSVVPMDPSTPMILDNTYYANVLVNKGLFTSDWTLRTNPATAAGLSANANNQAQWLNKFTAAIVKMGKIGVNTGTAGEIRTNCKVIN